MPAQMVVTLRGSPHHPLNGGVRRRRRSGGGRGRRRRRSQPGSQPATMGEVLHLRAGLHRLAGRFDSFREELEEQRRLQGTLAGSDPRASLRRRDGRRRSSVSVRSRGSSGLPHNLIL